MYLMPSLVHSSWKKVQIKDDGALLRIHLLRSMMKSGMLGTKQYAPSAPNLREETKGKMV